MLETTRNMVARLTRALPYFRGLGTGYRLINAVFNHLGAGGVVKVRMRNGTSLVVDLRTRTDIDAFYRGEYDPELIETVVSLCDVDASFLDVGANIGFHTTALAQAIKTKQGTGKVFAFEPFPGNCKRLIENLEINELRNLVDVFEIGLSDSERDEILALREDFASGAATGNASIATSDRSDVSYRKVPVRVRRLDDVWRDHGPAHTRIDFVKVDIEGHEDSFLEGATQTLGDHRPTIVMEVNKPYYEARRVDLDERLLGALPTEYHVFRSDGCRWHEIESLGECARLDDVFLVPGEKLKSEAYSRVFS